MSNDPDKSNPQPPPPPPQPEPQPTAPETFPQNNDWGFETVKRTTYVPIKPFGRD
jgi:hypothetical protein